MMRGSQLGRALHWKESQSSVRGKAMKPQMIFLMCSFLAWAGPSVGETPLAEGVISQLAEEGYTVTDVRRSWLGRVIITAESGDDLREVVLNRSSGEVMRDRVFMGAGEGREAQDARPRPEGERARPERENRPDKPEREGGGGTGGRP